MAVLPVRACPGGRRGPAAGTIGSSSIPCSQDGFSHGSCNRPAGRGDRSPPTGSRPQSPPYPADHRAAPALSQAEEIGAAPAHLRRDRARAELAESFGAGRASGRPQTTRTRPGPWSWTALPCRAGTGSTSRARTRAGTTEPGRASRTPAPRPEDPYGCPARPPGSTHDARAPQRTGLLDNPPDTPPLGDEGRIGPGMTTPIRRPPGGRTRGPAEAARQDHQFVTGPGRTSNSPVILSARSMFRLVRISMTRSRWSSSSWLTASVCPGIRPPSARLRRRGRRGGPR